MPKVSVQKTIMSNLLVEKTDKAKDDSLYNLNDMIEVFKLCDRTLSNCVFDLADIEQNLIPSLRSEYHIPPPQQPNKKFGGWALNTPCERRFDFYTTYNESGSPGTETPVVYRFTVGAFNINADNAARQIMSMKDTAWGVDPGLTIAVAEREGRSNIFKPISSSFDFGGLDNFGSDYKRLKSLGMLPASFGALEAAATTTNEAGNTVRPAKLKDDNQLEAYAATINSAFWFFVVHCLEIYGIGTEIIYEINQLTCKQRRIWSGIYFMGSGRGKKLLQQFYDNGWKLEQIEQLTEKIAAEKLYQQYRRGIVTAADAALLDRVMGPRLPPPTGRVVNYNWDSLKT